MGNSNSQAPSGRMSKRKLINGSNKTKQTVSNISSYQDDEPLIENPTTTEEEQKLDEKSLQDSFKLSLKLKNSIIRNNSFMDQIIPMLVSLKAERKENSTNSKETRVPLDLVCVIDVSGSMQGEKLQQLKDTFPYLFEYLSEQDRVSIVTFNSNAQRHTPLSCMSKKGKQSTLKKINGLEAIGGTNIAGGMYHAIQILAQRRVKNSVSSIFLLSDGIDRKQTIQAVQQQLQLTKMSSELSIHCFGYGNGHDPALMTGIADLADGNFYFIEKLETVDEYFIDCLGGLQSAIARQAHLKIFADNAEPLGDPGIWHKEDQIYTTEIQSLISGKSKDFVFNVKIPKSDKFLTDEEKQRVIASVEAQIVTIHNQKVDIKDTLKVTILNEDEDIPEESSDIEVMRNYYRLRSAEVFEKSTQLADQNEFEQAQKVLKDIKEELENCEFKDDQFIKNIIKDIDTSIENTSKENYGQSGRIRMIENARAQRQQKACLTSANVYQNPMQQKIVSIAKSRKRAY